MQDAELRFSQLVTHLQHWNPAGEFHVLSLSEDDLLLCADVMEVCARGLLMGWKSLREVLERALRASCYQGDAKRRAVFQMQYLFPYSQEDKKRLWTNQTLMARAAELLLSVALPLEEEKILLLLPFLCPWWLYTYILPLHPCTMDSEEQGMIKDLELQQTIERTRDTVMRKQTRFMAPPPSGDVALMDIRDEEAYWAFCFCHFSFRGVGSRAAEEQEGWTRFLRNTTLLRKLDQALSDGQPLQTETALEVNRHTVEHGVDLFGFTPAWYARDLRRGDQSQWDKSLHRTCNVLFMSA